MGKKDNIDTSIWVTQQALADLLGVSIQRVHNWVQRGKIATQKLPNSSITLVNKDTLAVKTISNV